MTADLAADAERQAAAFFASARRALVEAMPPDPDLAVLEIGCGSGATGALALRLGKAGSWIGIETDPKAAAEALYALTDVITLDPAGTPPLGSRSSFGLILATEGLLAFPRPERSLKAVVPLLRHGGRVRLALPGKGADKKAGLSAGQVKALVARAGLKLVSLKASGGGFLKSPKRIEAVAKR
jgi:SAM-dependent methyltransferase